MLSFVSVRIFIRMLASLFPFILLEQLRTILRSNPYCILSVLHFILRKVYFAKIRDEND